MLTFTRFLSVAAVTAGVLVGIAGPALADPIGRADCDEQPRPGCDVTATDPGSSPKPVKPGSGGTCRDVAGRKAPCHSDTAGDMSSDGCYYRPADVDAATEARMGGRPAGPGGWYWRTCSGDLDGSTNSRVLVWLRNVPVITPEVLGRQAASRLELPAVRVAASPTGAKLVNLPVWLWLSRSSWTGQSATARVPGLSVTATAKPQTATWWMGDGSTVTCRSAGARWRKGIEPRSESPDCGHVYRKSSAGESRGSYPVTVTVRWAVSWSGGGQSASLPAMSTSTTTRFLVEESQAVITG